MPGNGWLRRCRGPSAGLLPGLKSAQGLATDLASKAHITIYSETL